MSIKSLQDYTYFSRYAHYVPSDKRRENWTEAVDRVRNMHMTKYSDRIALFPEVEEEINWAFEQSRQKRVLGSQRALQFGGTPILKKNARIYNCTVSFCDRLRFFQEAFWLLLCGSGVGFSVQQHHVGKLPPFSKKAAVSRQGEWVNLKNGRPVKRFLIPDSIEGWADALGVLLGSYFNFPEFAEYESFYVEFDYTLIRKAGSPLASGIGKAPGPEPLRRSIELIRSLLDLRLQEGYTHLRPIDAYDILMHASDAVLSGGVRRSATICLFSPDDDEMLAAKTGNWFVENPQRGRSNNSVVLLRNKTTREQFAKIMESVKGFGEPGFLWTDDTELVVNPCVEIGMWPVCVVTGESGWSMCNLCELNGRKIKTKEDFKTAAKAGSIIGTLQAGYTDFGYLGDVTKRIVEREALLGVSITGMMDNPEILFDEDLQREMAQYILEVNEVLAPKLGIRPTARATCVKPAGTTSCVLGTASGIHPHHAKRYLRRIQANALETSMQWYKKHNPRAVEKSVWSANGTDEVITFTIEVPDGAKTKNDLDAITLLQHVRLTYKNWVCAGKVEDRCTKSWLSHNVSNTITVKPEEWDTVRDYIFENRDCFAGISLLPMSGDKDYQQAPMVAVYTPREIQQLYGDGSMMASGLIVDGLKAFDNNLWDACDASLGQGKPVQEPASPDGSVFIQHFDYSNQMQAYNAKRDWVRRAVQFADRYFSGDVKQMTYCLKDVNNLKTWLDLRREHKEVDYSLMIEEDDSTQRPQEWACSGGQCQLM